MPHTRSAKKNLRKNDKRRQHNRVGKREIKTLFKHFEDLLKEGTLEQLKEQYNVAAHKIDKAAARRIIHPNMAARKKSQLARMLNVKAAGPKPAAPAKK